MKTEMFVNSIFRNDKSGEAESVACRLRGVKDAKTFKLPVSAFPNGLPEQNDGLVVEITGELKVSENYVTAADAKVLDIKPGAGQISSVAMSAEDYIKSLQNNEPPF